MLQATMEPVSNREDWVQQCEVRDENNDLIDLSSAVIVLAVRDRKSKVQVLLAQTSDSTIVIQATGVFQFTFTESQMRGLDASRAYDLGCTLQLNGTTSQFFIGSVPVLDGIVP
jgi:hypothetical protein